MQRERQTGGVSLYRFRVPPADGVNQTQIKGHRDEVSLPCLMNKKAWLMRYSRPGMGCPQRGDIIIR